MTYALKHFLKLSLARSYNRFYHLDRTSLHRLALGNDEVLPFPIWQNYCRVALASVTGLDFATT